MFGYVFINLTYVKKKLWACLVMFLKMCGPKVNNHLDSFTSIFSSHTMNIRDMFGYIFRNKSLAQALKQNY